MLFILFCLVLIMYKRKKDKLPTCLFYPYNSSEICIFFQDYTQTVVSDFLSTSTCSALRGNVILSPALPSPSCDLSLCVLPPPPNFLCLNQVNCIHLRTAVINPLMIFLGTLASKEEKWLIKKK